MKGSEGQEYSQRKQKAIDELRRLNLSYWEINLLQRIQPNDCVPAGWQDIKLPRSTRKIGETVFNAIQNLESKGIIMEINSYGFLNGFNNYRTFRATSFGKELLWFLKDYCDSK